MEAMYTAFKSIPLFDWECPHMGEAVAKQRAITMRCTHQSQVNVGCLFRRWLFVFANVPWFDLLIAENAYNLKCHYLCFSILLWKVILRKKGEKETSFKNMCVWRFGFGCLFSTLLLEPNEKREYNEVVFSFRCGRKTSENFFPKPTQSPRIQIQIQGFKPGSHRWKARQDTTAPT